MDQDEQCCPLFRELQNKLLVLLGIDSGRADDLAQAQAKQTGFLLSFCVSHTKVARSWSSKPMGYQPFNVYDHNLKTMVARRYGNLIR